MWHFGWHYYVTWVMSHDLCHCQNLLLFLSNPDKSQKREKVRKLSKSLKLVFWKIPRLKQPMKIIHYEKHKALRARRRKLKIRPIWVSFMSLNRFITFQLRKNHSSWYSRSKTPWWNLQGATKVLILTVNSLLRRIGLELSLISSSGLKQSLENPCFWVLFRKNWKSF